MPTPAAGTPLSALQGGSAAQPLQARLHEQEKNEIVAAIDRNQGNIAGAARALGINRSTLYYRLRKHGLEHLLPTKPQGEPAAPAADARPRRHGSDRAHQPRGRHHARARRGDAPPRLRGRDLRRRGSRARARRSGGRRLDGDARSIARAFPCIKLEGGQWRPLGDYDAMLMRKDPPFDQRLLLLHAASSSRRAARRCSSTIRAACARPTRSSTSSTSRR